MQRESSECNIVRLVDWRTASDALRKIQVFLKAGRAMAIAFNKPLVCPVLIGRGHDLASLRLLVDRAKSDQGHVALLSGEAGIGKSRLVAEVKTEALVHDFWLLQGSCFPTDYAIPYAPLLDLLRSHIPSRELALAADIEPLSQTFLPLLPDQPHCV